MLLKMYKTDMKNISMPLLIVHGILLVLTVLQLIAAPFVQKSDFAAGAAVIIETLLLLTGAAAFVMTNLLLILRFYKRMYTDEGYLTNALPMTAGQLLFSHSLAYLSWFLIDMLVCTGSFFCLAHGAGFPEILPFMGFMVFTLLLGSIAVSCIMSGLAQLSCSLGHLFPEKKGLMTVIFYLLLGFAAQVYGMVSLFGSLILNPKVNLLQSFHDAAGKPIDVFGIYGPLELVFFVALMVLAVLMYLISRRVVRKHLNLA